MEFAFGRLVGIGGRADGDVLARDVLLGQIAASQPASVLFDVNLALEIRAIQFHKFMRVAGVAVDAAEFAAAIRIHGPAEGHAFGIATIQNRAHRQQKIFRAAFGGT